MPCVHSCSARKCSGLVPSHQHFGLAGPGECCCLLDPRDYFSLTSPPRFPPPCEPKRKIQINPATKRVGRVDLSKEKQATSFLFPPHPYGREYIRLPASSRLALLVSKRVRDRGEIIVDPQIDRVRQGLSMARKGSKKVRTGCLTCKYVTHCPILPIPSSVLASPQAGT